MKTLIIGDIHGCYREFVELVEQAGLSEDDAIIALGDLVDRGPDTPAVLKFFQNHSRYQSLLGNHERKHILAYQGLTDLSPSQIIVKEQLEETSYPEVIRWFQSFPKYIELPEAILIHGSLEPGVRLELQQENILTGSISGENYLSKKYHQPWYDLYDGEKPIIAGHHDYSKVGQPLIIRDLIYFIDTGCCYGKSLTGVILPDFKVISVKSKRNYWSELKQKYENRKRQSSNP